MRPPSRRDATALRLPAGGVVAGSLLVVIACSGGCTPDQAIRPGDVRSYAVPKDAEPAAIAAAGRSAADEPRAAGRADAIRYDVPEGWTDGGASGMRLATLLIGDPADKHEVTVIPAAGSLAGNVERWQGQLDGTDDPESLKAKAAAAIEAAETVEAAGGAATVVLLRDETDQAILGAMIPLAADRALFVKFKGDASVALRERDRFRQFVSSIRWQEP